MSAATNGHDEATAKPVPASNVPEWLSKITLEKAVQAQIGDFANIIAVTPQQGSSEGENYSSLFLRLLVDVELFDHFTKSLSFVLKAQPNNDVMAAILGKLKLFQKEELMYHSILPKFEQLYADAGKPIQFAPKAFKVDRDLGVDYILLEDLQKKNFKNANRLAGLDLNHMQRVLEKLAAFHAASACYVEHHGFFGEEFVVGVFSEANRQLLQEFNASGAFLAQLKKWKNAQKIYEKLADSDNYLVDRLLQDQQFNAREFNVLNHGDCWANNIMFQHDAFGTIKETLFVDFQVGKYGSPANDLYYLILSSAAPELKAAKFDYLVRFYFDNLIENLKLLQYHRPLPKLKNLHAALFRNGLAAYMVVSKVLPVVMLDKTNNANLESYMNDESKMKVAMFTNPKYVQVMTELLPWLDNRGLLDWK
ncbi:uncharacterized protein LOC108157774 [Drosophila miranda]|uniref:uncharacterized protein LOC108157774 n=1 Tax=Drosophila miranda TaxID=7229 RepID=UPI0007E7AD3F|nr:uncharacterized protein LOC108157774 [Drosophila miranda]XP_017145451.1 uncharacterized protein LOC108157774 [Drosophila miranda]XP_017145452.1 uncharacterized protein LOC108157774 [Drosophila miranda]XP_033245582.1 uncharacterized protein LOC108157774 [Drosophila miranda]